ncbi:hypothetical protein DCCM_2928 [Desulfocucumis palustris]|uniref:Uncharacterized protein n=1 Tax=Desulfocucumis palustris TaxID=1898651 RepID=A0A2L2XBW9_9FIRM|nr:hypothetical protein DCCM_2928 [Desulfocucumis palustris]
MTQLRRGEKTLLFVIVRDIVETHIASIIKLNILQANINHSP